MLVLASLVLSPAGQPAPLLPAAARFKTQQAAAAAAAVVAAVLGRPRGDGSLASESLS